MTTALDRPFNENEAKAVLDSWCKERKFKVHQLKELTRWDYTDPPFYTASGLLYRHSWPEKARFHIHQNGEVSIFIEGG
jgi:hypothetical protein